MLVVLSEAFRNRGATYKAGLSHWIFTVWCISSAKTFGKLTFSILADFEKKAANLNALLASSATAAVAARCFSNAKDRAHMAENIASMSKLLRSVTRQDKGQDASLDLDAASRSCTLTRLLMDTCSSPDSRTLVVLCCSADARDREEAIPAIKFGADIQKLKPQRPASPEIPEPDENAPGAKDVREEIRALMGKYRLKKSSGHGLRKSGETKTKKQGLPARERMGAAKRRAAARERLRNALFDPSTMNVSAEPKEENEIHSSEKMASVAGVKRYFETKKAIGDVSSMGEVLALLRKGSSALASAKAMQGRFEEEQENGSRFPPLNGN